MSVYVVLCLLVIFQGYDCAINDFSFSNQVSGKVKFIINTDTTACVLDNTLETLYSTCIGKTADKELAFDYDYNEGTIHYFSYSEVKYGITNESKREVVSQHIFPGLASSREWVLPECYDVVDLTLDWLHYTMYIVDMGGQRLTGYQRYNPETGKSFEKLDLLNDTSIDPRRLAGPAGLVDEHMAFKDLQLDPYNQSLFTKISIGEHLDNSTTVIIRSDLVARNPRQIPEKRFSNEMVFYVDVNELKLYILDKGTLFFYDYNGHLEQSIIGPNGLKSFVVFNKEMYVYVKDANTLSTMLTYSLKNIQFGVPSSISVAARFRADNMRFMLFDVRSKRRMINGTYVCDRTDCQDFCEVTQTGEYCVCRKRAQAQDGLSCYDCGQSNLTSMPAHLMIVGGQDASRSDFPWHSVLYELKEGVWEQVCGGTLITSTIVLTAAHCVTDIGTVPELKKTENLMVALGKIQRGWNSNESTETKMHVKEIQPHDSFMGSAVNFGFDIALLVLESKVTFNRYVMPACIDFNNKLPYFENPVAYVPGFGYTEECGSLCSDPSKELKYSKTTEIQSFVECFSTSQSIDHSIFVMLTPDKFCIGNGSASAVQKGDSGGGLTLAYKGLHYVTGIVSIKFVKVKRKGDGPLYSYSFGAFTNVSFHMDWLKSKLPKDG